MSQSPVPPLTGVSRHAYEKVLQAFQDAEEAGGPEGQEYIALMLAVIHEARGRIAARRSAALDLAREVLAVLFNAELSFPYQAFLRDGRCVLVAAGFREHRVIRSDLCNEDRPKLLPTGRVPQAVLDICRQVLLDEEAAPGMHGTQETHREPTGSAGPKPAST